MQRCAPSSAIEIASQAATRDEQRATLACILLAIAVTAIAWSAVPWGTFHFDDYRNVVRDPATTDFAVLLERLPHGLRPLTRLSYFVDARLYGLQPAGFLTTNLVLHACTVLLVFALARRRLDYSGALIAALLFAVQPANAEVVAYVSGRSTGLMTPLLLGALLLYDQQRLVGALGLFVAACLAKEHALVFPLLVLAWESTRVRPQPGGIGKVLAATIVSTLIFGVLLASDHYRMLLSHAAGDKTFEQNVLENARAIPEMLSLWVRPWALSADHAFDERLQLGKSLAGLLLLVTGAASAVVARHRAPMLALAILWAFIALLPTNSVLAKPDLITEKPLYLAWVGPSIAFGSGIAAVLRARAMRAKRQMLIGAVAVMLCVLTGASIWRASLWRDPVALWSDAIEKAPEKSRCWNNLGMAHLAVQRHAEAVSDFERAVFLDPRNEYANVNLMTARTLCGTECSGP
jgi:protein O-mannosyl-transferase